MAFLSRARGLDFGNFVNVMAPALSIASTRLVTCHDMEALERVIPILTSKFRRIPVICRKTGDFRGLVTAVDVLDYLGAGPRYNIFIKRYGSLRIPVKSIMETRILSLDKNHSIGKALEAFHRERRGAYPIVYRGKLMGIISEWDFVKNINSPIGVKVEDLMVRKPLVLRDNFSLLDAAKIMVRSRIRRLPVAKDNILLGIVTPSDILSCLGKNNLLKDLRRDKSRITMAMKREVVTLDPGLDLYEAARIMTRKRIGGLPVVEDSELLGILTERDIVDALRY